MLPQVDGVTQAALWMLDEAVTRELNARPENALVEAGRTLPTGNFHNAELAAALDSMRNALAQSASLIAARVSALLDPRMTGLPPFLADSPGRDSGMMMLEYTAHSAAAEIRSLAMPSGTQTTWASLGVESHASLSSIAVRRTGDALDALRVLVATELVVAMRAIRHAGRTPAGAGTQRLFELADEVLPGGLEDRAFGRDVELARAVLERWASLPTGSGVDRRLADAP